MSASNPGAVQAFTSPATGVKKIKDLDLGSMAVQESGAVNVSGGAVLGATLSGAIQEISEAGAVSLNANHAKVTGPAESTYAITLAAPSRPGQVLAIEMVATTGTNAVTLALTNVLGGTAASSASFDAAGETLVLVSNSTKWVVLKEQGVTLS
ncbi:MAG: hypothetical protein AB7D37_10960 [Desulfovibrio sp.]